MGKLVAVFAGDGIGPEIMVQARRVLDALGLDGISYEEGLVGGAAYKAVGHPLPPETLDIAKRADAILFGAVGISIATIWNGTCGRNRRSSACVKS